MASKTPSAKPSRPAPYRFTPARAADEIDIWDSFSASPSSAFEESFQRIRDREREARAARLRSIYDSGALIRPTPQHIDKRVPAPVVKKVGRSLQITPDDVREAMSRPIRYDYPLSPPDYMPAASDRFYEQVDSGEDDGYVTIKPSAAPARREPKAAELPPTARPTPKTRTPLPDDPTLMIGIEFEGILCNEIEGPFKRALRDLVRDSYGDTLIQFGVDNSVKGYDPGFSPIEIRTAPMPLTQGLEAFELMLSFLYLASETGDWITNATCGLHINVSERSVFKRKMQKTFYLNVLHRFDEMSVLEAFDRVDNRYCLPFLDDEEVGTTDLDEIEMTYDAMKDRERAALNAGSSGRETRESKYLACSLRDSPTHDSYAGPETTAQRIEFRCIGNEDYHLAFEQLDESVNHMMDVVHEAYHAVRAAIPTGAPTKRRATTHA